MLKLTALSIHINMVISCLKLKTKLLMLSITQHEILQTGNKLVIEDIKVALSAFAISNQIYNYLYAYCYFQLQN